MRCGTTFPLVLVEGARAPEFVRSLSSLIDTMLKDVAPRGIEGERLRRHALQLEREIRHRRGPGRPWQPVRTVGAGRGAAGCARRRDAGTGAAARRRRREREGQVVGCTQQMPAQPDHARLACRAARQGQAFQADLSRLVLKLSDILRAAHSHSQAGASRRA
jgi:hypothetical protein